MLEDDATGVALCVDGIGVLVGALPVSRGEDLVPASAGEGDVGALALGEALRGPLRVGVEVGALGSLRGLDVVELIDELGVVQFVGVVIPDERQPASAVVAVFQRFADGELVLGVRRADDVATDGAYREEARLGLPGELERHAYDAAV